MEDYHRAFEKMLGSLGLNIIPVPLESNLSGKHPSVKLIWFPPEKKESLNFYWDEDEQIKKIECIDLFSDFKTLKKPIFFEERPEKTLQYLFYLLDEKIFIRITIRGDYSVEPLKLKRLLSFNQIRPAFDDEMKEAGIDSGLLSGKKSQKIIKLIDKSVLSNKNYRHI